MTDEERRELAELRTKLTEIEGAVAQLSDRVVGLEAGPAAPVSPPAAATPAPTAARAPHKRRAAPKGPQPTEQLVRFVRDFLTEGNPLNKLGALSMIVGAGIVFKYAVDNGWIGPTGRVVLGLAIGAALLAVGELYAQRSWQRFASGLVSAGNGVIFLAVWFGQQQYEVIPPPLAFTLYVVFTAFVVAQSLRYDSMALAIWGLIGGYLVPALASTGTGNYVFLSSYLLVLNAGVFAIAYRRNWQPLKWMAFLLTLAYTTSWVIDFSEHPGETQWLELHWLLPFLAAFFVSFAAIPTWRSLRLHEPIDAFGQVLTVANGVVHFAFVAIALQDEHRAWLGGIATGVALLYAAVASRLTREPVLDARCLRVFAGSAAGFLVLATPYLVSGHWITLVWCAETVLLAWACTQPRFQFLRLHVLAMLVIVLARLIAFDEIFLGHWPDPGTRYLPFTELRSWPPFAAVVTFGLVARLLDRAPGIRLPLLPVSAVIGLGGILMIAAVDAEVSRFTRYTLLPLANYELNQLVGAGLLISIVAGLWLAARRWLGESTFPWLPSFVLTAVLLFWTFEMLTWSGGYGHQERILGEGLGRPLVLWWLHGGVLLMTPLLILLVSLARQAPERSMRMSREQLRGLLLGVALVVTMLLLRREAFAITHAPPLMDWIPDEARRAGFRSILSVSYALLAFGVYVQAVRTGNKMQLYAAYGLYVFTALKVYLFDLESQNQLYRASSLIIFAAILFVSSYYANKRSANEPDPSESTERATGPTSEAPEHA